MTAPSTEFAHPASKRMYIYGSNPLQNKLLSDFLTRETGILCSNGEHFDEALTLFETMEPGQQALILIEFAKEEIEQLWLQLSLCGNDQSERVRIALFNVGINVDGGLVDLSIFKRIRGVFYRNVPLSQLVKGVQAILAGDLWFSRKLTKRMLLLKTDNRRDTERKIASLTSRERELLLAAASGLSNNQIAEEFSISLHTVKSHLYRVYKKINVSNRLQMTLWVAKHI
jgi:LuxR family transcriptional regulator of csgAB operon